MLNKNEDFTHKYETAILAVRADPPNARRRLRLHPQFDGKLAVVSDLLTSFREVTSPQTAALFRSIRMLVCYSKSPNQQITKPNAVSPHNPSARTLSPSSRPHTPIFAQIPRISPALCAKTRRNAVAGRGEKLDFGSIGPWFG